MADARGGQKGDRVRVRKHLQGGGKYGIIAEVAPSGHFFGVSSTKGKDLGYYHESDLKIHPDDAHYQSANKRRMSRGKGSFGQKRVPKGSSSGGQFTS